MGKFDSKLAEALYDLSLDSSQDDECGDVSVCGFWAARFDTLECLETEHAILIEDEQGFVSAESFDSLDDLETRWNELLEASADDSDSADDSEQL